MPPRDQVLHHLRNTPHAGSLADLARQTWSRRDRQEAALASLGDGVTQRGLAPVVRAPFAPQDTVRSVGRALAGVL